MAKILVVDDEEDIRQVVQITLESRGHEVTTVVDGREALRALEKFTPDLVVLDVMMPDINGLEVAERIRNNPEWADIPVVMLTAVTEQANQSDDYWREKMKVADFISKPFDIMDLLKRVERLIE